MQSTELTQNGYSHTLNGIRKRVAVDPGNRFIKWIDASSRMRCIPSAIKELEPWEDSLFDEKSVLLEIEEKRYIIGQAASELSGIPTYERDKSELAKLLGLVALEPQSGHDKLLVETLVIATPDTRNKQALANLKKLEGTHEFTLNGQWIVATVRRVEPIDETRAAYQFAIKKGLFAAPNKVNGILDLGGGTSIGRIYTGNGTLNRAADCLLPGSFHLAQKVGAALIPQLGHSPNNSLIMDAIASGNYIYGTTEIDFKAIFLKCQADWIADIRAKLKNAWVDVLPVLGEVLIIGGSAPLAQPLVDATKNRFKIAPNPQFANVWSMAS